MQTNNSNFLKWKQQIETFDYQQPIDLLRTIEINLSNICQLKCVFCPHGNNWISNNSIFMSIHVVKEIVKQLHNINFSGYICIAGHGEPTLNPNLIQILEELHDFNTILITNGLSSNINWQTIDKLTTIKVSLHNELDLPLIQKNLLNTNYDIRIHTNNSTELFKNNRAGFLKMPNNNINKKCYYPYYELFIDTDGTYRLCASQWINKFNYSIFDISIYQHFIKHLYQIKYTMMKKNRSAIQECFNCNSQGIIIGENIFNIWKTIK